MKKYQGYDLGDAPDFSDVDETVEHVQYLPRSALKNVGDDVVEIEDVVLPEALPNPAKPAPNVDKYDSSEHDMIGQKAFDLFRARHPELLDMFIMHGYMNKSHEWVFPHHQINFGKIIALAGDYFGIADLPICEGVNLEDRKERFRKAYSTLVKAKKGKVEKLKKVIDKDIVEYYQKADMEEEPTVGIGSYVKLATIGGLPLTILHSLYLASHNFDHFGNDAFVAYQAGHRVAIETAVEAASYPQDSSERYETLAMAFTMELFACHFLTDLFASGHVRTPRRQIYNHVKGKIRDQLTEELGLLGAFVAGMGGEWAGEWVGQQIGESIPGIHLIAGFLAKAMHDEDNHKGLNVESPSSHQHGETWTTYGDACYIKISPANRERIATAVLYGLLDVLKFHQHPEIPLEENIASEAQIPLTPPSPTLNPEFKPLFKVIDDDTVALRPHLSKTTCEDEEYNPRWSIRYTCAELIARNYIFSKFKKREEQLSQEERDELMHNSRALQKEILDLYGEHIGRDVLEVDGKERSCVIL